MHAHADFIDDVWLFQGAAHEVFDNLDTASQSLRKVNYSPGIIAMSKLNIKARQIKPNPAALACSYMSNSRPEHLMVGGRLSVFQRKVRCPIVGKIRDFVIIAFHASTKSNPWYRPSARMHAYVKIFSGGNASLMTHAVDDYRL